MGRKINSYGNNFDEKRKATIAVCLLLCILTRELSSSQDTMRARNGRTRTTRVTRGQRGRRSRRNKDLLLEF